MLSEIKTASKADIIGTAHKKEIELAKTKKEKANAWLMKKQQELTDYQNEAIRVIRGESALDANMLNELVGQAKEKYLKAKEDTERASEEYEEMKASAKQLLEEYDNLISWADLYARCSFDSKKMIIAQLVNAVRVGNDYSIEIDFNITFEEFKQFCLPKSA